MCAAPEGVGRRALEVCERMQGRVVFKITDACDTFSSPPPPPLFYIFLYLNCFGGSGWGLGVGWIGNSDYSRPDAINTRFALLFACVTC